MFRKRNWERKCAYIKSPAAEAETDIIGLMRGNRTRSYLISFIRKLLQLTSKERDVLIERLKMQTLEKIGLKYKVTEGRIRQIEKEAIKKAKRKIYQQRLFKKEPK